MDSASNLLTVSRVDTSFSSSFTQATTYEKELLGLKMNETNEQFAYELSKCFNDQ